MKKLFASVFILAAITVASPGQDIVVLRRPAVAPSTLNNNLVSFWKLDEASNSTRNDSIGSNHLADVNTNVPQTSGQIGNAVQMGAAGSKQLRIADNASLSITGDLTIVLWVRADSLPGAGQYPGLVSKWGNGSDGGKSYVIDYDGDSSRFSFVASPDGSAQTPVTASTFGAPSTVTWYFIVAQHDDAANTIGISVNNGTIDTAAFTGPIFNSTANFEVGVLANLFFCECKEDALGIWSRKLTALELTKLYNGGAGCEYPWTACP